MYKLIIALYVITAITVQFSTTHEVNNQEIGILMEWNKPDDFCGAFLEELIKEICKGELPEYWKYDSSLPLPLKCCFKCSPLSLKQKYCKPKRPAAGRFINMPKKIKTAFRLSVHHTKSPLSTTTPDPIWPPPSFRIIYEALAGKPYY